LVIAGDDNQWDLQDLCDLINMDDLKDLDDFSPKATFFTQISLIPQIFKRSLQVHPHPFSWI